MKFETTRKAIVNSTPSTYLFSVGYCGMQYLLNYENAVAYTHGVYGWNFDVYNICGYVICTGYRNMPGKSIRDLDKYEKLASKLINNWNINYEKKRPVIHELLVEVLHNQLPNEEFHSDKALKKAKRLLNKANKED